MLLVESDMAILKQELSVAAAFIRNGLLFSGHPKKARTCLRWSTEGVEEGEPIGCHAHDTTCASHRLTGVLSIMRMFAACDTEPDKGKPVCSYPVISCLSPI